MSAGSLELCSWRRALAVSSNPTLSAIFFRFKIANETASFRTAGSDLRHDEWRLSATAFRLARGKFNAAWSGEIGLLLSLRIRIVGAVKIMCVSGTVSRNLNNHRSVLRSSKVIVAQTTRFRIHTPRRKRFQQLGVEMVAVAEVPLAGYDGGDAIIAM
jgi:hypothetical protein